MAGDTEKGSTDANRSQDEEVADIPKDPDAHLSPEERAKVVGSSPAQSSGWSAQIYDCSHLNSRNDDFFGG